MVDRVDEWVERAWTIYQCRDPDTLMEFIESCMEGKTPEGAKAIYDAFLNEFLPRWREYIEEEFLARWEYDVKDFFKWYAAAKEYAELADIAEYFKERLRERLIEAIEAAIETDPRAKRDYRPYMRDIAQALLEAYLERPGITQREIAELTGYSLHSVWNTTWWLRRYTGKEVWPGWD